MWDFLKVLKSKLGKLDYQKLSEITNSKVYQFIAEAAQLCNPKKIFICSDTPEKTFRVIQEQRERILKARKEFAEYISPFSLHNSSVLSREKI